MTAVLEPPNVLGRRPAGSDALNDFLDVVDLDLDGLGSAELAAELAGWERAVRRVEALKLRVLAHAQTAEVAKASGLSGTDAWMARTTKTNKREASRQVRLATALDDGLAVTATALGQGMLSTGHAAVIVDATANLPASVSADERRVIEHSLVAKAQDLNPTDLRRVARRCLEAITTDAAVVDEHENGILESEEADARAPDRVVDVGQRRRHGFGSIHGSSSCGCDPAQDDRADDLASACRSQRRTRPVRSGRL